MTDPFTQLGAPRHFRLDLRALEQTHRDLARTLHPDQFLGAPPAERRMVIERAAAVNDAWRTLKHPLSRAVALLATVGLELQETARAEPALLGEVLALREELESAREAANMLAIGRLKATVRARAEASEQALVQAFDEREGKDAEANARALQSLVQLKYFYRFLEEADAAEEAADA